MLGASLPSDWPPWSCDPSRTLWAPGSAALRPASCPFMGRPQEVPQRPADGRTDGEHCRRWGGG